MTDRNNLIKLIQEAEDEYMVYEMAEQALANEVFKSREEYIADYLITTGVILSPVDIGKTVYKVSLRGKIVSLNVVNYDYDVITSPYDLMSFNSFGKTVFLTREEAEKALERSNGND